MSDSIKIYRTSVLVHCMRHRTEWVGQSIELYVSIASHMAHPKIECRKTARKGERTPFALMRQKIGPRLRLVDIYCALLLIYIQSRFYTLLIAG